MAGFSGFDPVIRRLGGIASRRELRLAGWNETELWFAWQYGNLDRIRIGWYASSDLPTDARAAWRAGGPLACVSALRYYGMLPSAESAESSESAESAESAVGSAAEELHICLPAGGRVGRDAPAGLVVHWSTVDRYSGTRQAVSRAAALRQARVCARRQARDGDAG
jgi:hypothetical protein